MGSRSSNDLSLVPADKNPKSCVCSPDVSWGFFLSFIIETESHQIQTRELITCFYRVSVQGNTLLIGFSPTCNQKNMIFFGLDIENALLNGFQHKNPA